MLHNGLVLTEADIEQRAVRSIEVALGNVVALHWPFDAGVGLNIQLLIRA